MKKSVLMLCSAMALTALLAGCGGAPAASTPAPAATQEAASAEQEVFVVYRDTKVAMGMKYADVQAALGEESKPADVITPCDGSTDIRDTMHFYGKLAVTEDRDGVIKGLDMNSFYEGESEATFMGKVALGDKEDVVKAALGESQGNDADYLEYTVGSVNIGVSLDSDAKTVTSVSVYVG